MTSHNWLGRRVSKGDVLERIADLYTLLEHYSARRSLRGLSWESRRRDIEAVIHNLEHSLPLIVKVWSNPAGKSGWLDREYGKLWSDPAGNILKRSSDDLKARTERELSRAADILQDERECFSAKRTVTVRYLDVLRANHAEVMARNQDLVGVVERRDREIADYGVTLGIQAGLTRKWREAHDIMLDSDNNELKELKAHHLEVQDRNEKLLGLVNKRSKKIAELKADVVFLAKQRKGKDYESFACKAEVRRLKDDESRHDADVANLEKELEEKSGERGALILERRDLIADMNKLKDEMAERRTDIDRMMEERNKCATNAQHAEERADILERTVTGLNREIVEAKDRAARMAKNTVRTHEKLVKLRKEVGVTLNRAYIPLGADPSRYYIPSGALNFLRAAHREALDEESAAKGEDYTPKDRLVALQEAVRQVIDSPVPGMLKILEIAYSDSLLKYRRLNG